MHNTYSTHMSLQGKTALITGGISGIGLAITSSMYQLGAKIIVAANQNTNEALNTLRNISPKLERIQYNYVNLVHEQENKTLIKNLLNQSQEIDILVCNAGIQHIAPIHQFSFQEWNNIISLNLSSAFYLANLVLPSMQHKGFGRIINISSVHGLVASPNKGAYVAAKHGIIGLTKVIALENAKKGITCNAICPGFVKTAIVEKQIQERAKVLQCTTKEAAHNMLSNKHPNEQFIQVDDVAATVAFLCSTSAKHITGSSFTIDGGWTAQ